MPEKKKKRKSVKRKPAKRKPSILAGQWVSMLLISILSLLLYANTFQNKFVWDDSVFILDNESIKNPQGIAQFFTSPSSFSAKGDLFIYRPLAALSFALDWRLWKLKTFPYHILNLLFYTLCGIMLYMVMQRLSRNNITALFVALIFIAHPVHTESVTWIAARSDGMFLLFLLLSLLFYMKYISAPVPKKTPYFILSLIWYALSLLSKETAIVLPLLLVLCDFYSAARHRVRKTLYNAKYYVWFVLVAVAYLYLRYSVFGRWGGKEDIRIGENIFSGVFTMSRVAAHYIRLLFFPVGQSAIYMVRISSSIKDVRVIVSLLLITVFVLTSILLARKSRETSFCILWFFVALLPVLNIIPMQNVIMAERFLFLPSIGFCMFLGTRLSLLIKSRRKQLKKSALFLFFSILVFYSLKTMARNRDWKDDFTFWKQASVTAPSSDRVHTNLGLIYDSRLELARAIEEYKKSLELNPDNAEVYFRLGIDYDKAGWYELAMKMFLEALKKDPLNGSIHSALGSIYARTGLYENAFRQANQALKLKGDDASAYNTLGLVYERRGNYSLAISYYRRALELSGEGTEARTNYNRAYRMLNRRRMTVY